jgi:hypothetical protein
VIYSAAHIEHTMIPFMRKVCCLVLLYITAGTGLLWSQSSFASEYQVKAVFLFNFTHFIEWPERAFDNSYSTFIIGIIGDDPFGPYLTAAVEGERLGTHIIRVERFKSVSEIKKCHILYVGSKDPVEIKNILSSAAGKSILTVGDTPNFVRWGGMIRFYTEQNRIRLNINNTLARQAGLRISSKLLRVADVL